MAQVGFSSSEERMGGHSAVRRQRGIAAVEMALLLPVFLILLALPLYFGRFFWHYQVACSAAQDAARYLSSVPLVEMRNPSVISQSVAVANEIIQRETAELNPGLYPPAITIQCDGITCSGFFTPSNVAVIINMQIDDPFFSGLTALSIPVLASATYPYLGK